MLFLSRTRSVSDDSSTCLRISLRLQTPVATPQQTVILPFDSSWGLGNNPIVAQRIPAKIGEVVTLVGHFFSGVL